MHVAAGKGHTESVCVLLENGADVTSERALDGATPLWVACDAGHLNTAAALLDHPNINPNARNNEGTSPIESACSRNHHHVVELLISKGVSSFVDSNLWMGLRFGSWMARKQVPELAYQQCLLDKQKEKEEAEKAAQEEISKTTDKKKTKKRH